MIEHKFSTSNLSLSAFEPSLIQSNSVTLAGSFDLALTSLYAIPQSSTLFDTLGQSRFQLWLETIGAQNIF